MKKFVLTITAYCLLLGLLVSGINFLYISKANDDSMGTDRFKYMPETIDICNLGSSHGNRSFVYTEHTDLSTFNFGHNAQTLSYDYRLLDFYQDHLSEGSVVFIPISYFSFFGTDETELSDFESKNKRYYLILPKSHIKEYDFITYLCTVPFPATSAGAKLFITLFKKDDSAPKKESIRTADMLDLSENVSTAYWKHFINNRLDSNGNLLLNDIEVQAVYDIIDLCRSKNAIPILVTTPLLQEYTDLVIQKHPDFLPYFYDIVNHISEDTGTLYLDYAFDERFKNDYSLFMDCDHLNTNGAILFTDIVLNDIKNIT